MQENTQPGSRVPAPRRPAFPRSRRALTLLGVAVLAILIVVRVGLATARSGAIGTAEVPAVSPSRIEVPPVLAAHGVVQPIARASLATLGGGSVAELAVDIGQVVEQGQVLARITTPSQAELVFAPWRGTISSIAVHAGDTVLPGAGLLTLADLSRYQVETTDVDEYLIARIQRMQPATLTVDALMPLALRGMVLSISSQSQPVPGGGVHYPTVIGLPGATPELRPGMSVHVVFER